VRDQKLDGRGLTFSTDVQYVIPIGTAWFVEPSAGVYISRVNMDNQTSDFGVASFGTIASNLSRVGVRAGVATQAGNVLLQPFVAANVYHEWAGDARTRFTTIPAAGGAAQTLAIDTTRIGTFEQASVGVGWQVPGSGFTGYVRTDAKFGRQVEGWTLTAGLRYNW
jgi:outer membrane autotransporter protein